VNLRVVNPRFAPERVCKILAREGKRLRDSPEMGRHLG
jgi:hypothetical protein